MPVLLDLAQLTIGRAWLWGPIVLGAWVTTVAIVLWMVVGNARSSEEVGLEKARKLLAARYARGELTEEEYRDRLGRMR